MSDKERDDLSTVDELNVEPLSDEDLDLASGGCSCTNTTSACSATGKLDVAEV
jgi:hypothetical protein